MSNMMLESVPRNLEIYARRAADLGKRTGEGATLEEQGRRDL